MLQLVAGLQARGHPVMLLARRGAPGSRPQTDDVHVVTIPGGVDLNPVGVAKTILALRRWRADLLVIWTTKDTRIAGVGGKLAGVPVLVRRAYETELPRKLRHRIFHEWVPARFMANAQATRRSLLRSIPTLRGEDVAVIYNGIEVDAVDAIAPVDLELPDKAMVVGFLSRLDQVKGVRELMQAWPVIAHAVPQAHLVIAGTGELDERVRSWAETASRVHYLGFRSDAIGILKSVDLLVLPSYREGTPNIIMEAMACGRCIVATAVSGTPELVQDGATARLIPPYDAEMLAQTTVELLHDAEARARLGAAARERISAFNFEGMVDEYVALFSEMMGRAAEHR